MWTETTVPGVLGIPSTPEYQLYARKSTAELYREGGFDAAMFLDEPGIEVDYSFCPARDRDGWTTMGANTPLERMCMFRDHDFLDAATLDVVHAQRRPGAFIFNGWVEAWGDHKWFPCEPDDPQARELAVMSGKPAEGIFRINSTYPKDGFWWDSQLRITPAMQAGVHFMEYYAHAVAELDACRITRGGLFLDTAHCEQLRRFARAYRTLPREKFDTVGPATDPVAVRTLVRDGKRYVYLVNRDYYPIDVAVRLTGSPGRATDLATGRAVETTERWAMVLGPYELRSFALPPSVEIEGFAATPPAEIVEQLAAAARQALARVEQLRAAGKPLPPGAEPMAEGINKALADGRWAWLRRALSSYAIRKSR